MRYHERQRPARSSAEEGRLTARPVPQTTYASRPGLHPLGLANGRDGLLYVPASYTSARPTPLVVLLHGAGGNAQHGLAPLLPLADTAGLLLLAPDSRRQTWDIILGRYGSDIGFIDQALTHTFSRYAVDPAHIAIGGFSDGASYALSVGITNGDLFSTILAFSPGFCAPADQIGQPRIYIAHGTRDTVLPITACSRRIVPQLQSAGYDLHYQEFDGPHTVPSEIAQAASSFFLGSEARGDVDSASE